MSDTLNTPIYPGARSGQGAYDYLSSEEMRALADSYPNQHRPDPYEEAYQDLQNRIHLKKFERHELKCSIVHDFRMMILNGIQNSEERHSRYKRGIKPFRVENTRTKTGHREFEFANLKMLQKMFFGPEARKQRHSDGTSLNTQLTVKALKRLGVFVPRLHGKTRLKLFTKGERRGRLVIKGHFDPV